MNTELWLEMVPSNATTCLGVRLGVWGWHPLALLTVDMTSSTFGGWCLWRSCRCICRWYHGCLKWCHYVWGWSHCSLGWCHNLLQCFEVKLWAASLTWWHNIPLLLVLWLSMSVWVDVTTCSSLTNRSDLVFSYMLQILLNTVTECHNQTSAWKSH